MMILVVNCGSCAEWIAKCLRSVQDQTVQDWRAFVTIDTCRDDTAVYAEEFAQRDRRFSVKVNQNRKYSLANQVSAILRSGSDPEDVIVSLDGDDWFATKDALRIISDKYADPAVWMTYGSWHSPGEVGFSPDGSPLAGLWPAYPDGTTDFRNFRWLGTAVRTWKRWLWECLPDAVLRDTNGNYFRITEDRVIMIPLLEMCSTEHAWHIPEPIMEYNQVSSYDGRMSQESDRVVALVKAGKPFQRISGKRLQDSIEGCK